MRHLLFLFIITVASDAIGQQNPSLSEMINAEKSFAAHARDSGISSAFMKYLDDSAKVFERGQILNGKEVWGPRKTDSASLLWYPEFGEVAASGDLGYTTGPSQFRVSKSSAEPEYRGYFSSIWYKNKTGEWKVLLDMGSPAPASQYDETKVEYGKAVSPSKRSGKGGKADMEKLEKAFNEANVKGEGYSTYGSPDARYYRPGQNVIRKKGADMSGYEKLLFRTAGTGSASSGDFGYAYGYVTAEGSTGNFLRVWKKTGGQWSIVLEVANY